MDETTTIVCLVRSDSQGKLSSLVMGRFSRLRQTWARDSHSTEWARNRLSASWVMRISALLIERKSLNAQVIVEGPSTKLNNHPKRCRIVPYRSRIGSRLVEIIGAGLRNSSAKLTVCLVCFKGDSRMTAQKITTKKGKKAKIGRASCRGR